MDVSFFFWSKDDNWLHSTPPHIHKTPTLLKAEDLITGLCYNSDGEWLLTKETERRKSVIWQLAHINTVR